MPIPGPFHVRPLAVPLPKSSAEGTRSAALAHATEDLDRTSGATSIEAGPWSDTVSRGVFHILVILMQRRMSGSALTTSAPIAAASPRCASGANHSSPGFSGPLHTATRRCREFSEASTSGWR